jgi:acetyl esterase/lipase
MTGYNKYTHTYKQGEDYSIDLDVYMPDKAKSGLTVIIYIHGGALIWGSRENVHKAELDTVLSEGMAYVSIDYRLAPETKLADIKTDIEDVLRWVREDGVRLYGFAANRVAVLGKSAGGYLALLSGTFPNKPDAIVSFYGYGDIVGEWYAKPSKYYLKQPHVSNSEANACITNSILVHAGMEKRWPLYLYTRQTGTWASIVSDYPANKVQTALSPYCPVYNVEAQFPPTLLLHGTADTDVPMEQSAAMHDALTSKGIKAQLRIIPEAEHVFEAAWRNVPNEYGQVIQFIKDTCGRHHE